MVTSTEGAWSSACGFPQDLLADVYGVNNVRRTEVHTAGLLILRFILKSLKRYKSPGTEQIPEKLIKAGSKT
jgi:hypothetical protein